MCASSIKFGPAEDRLAETAYLTHTPTGSWSSLSETDKDVWRGVANAVGADAVTLKYAQASGTWLCVPVTGGGSPTPVDNPGNCGPDDLALWCDNWGPGANGVDTCLDS